MNPLRFPVSLVLLTVLGLVVGAAFGQLHDVAATNDDAATVNHRQPASLYLGETQAIDLDNTLAVFAYVFSRLDSSVNVYPTENYLYFRFLSGSQHVWGNLRLSPVERDEGLVHIGYYDLPENLESLEGVKMQHRVLSEADGIALSKLDDFHYSLSYNGKTVVLALNQLPQDPPRSFALLPDEEMVFRLQDESNVRFFLLFDTSTATFMYVADEEDQPLNEVAWLTDDVVIDTPSGFVFFADPADAGRKILIGVRDSDVQTNTYYDGPFDQLADNFIGEGSRLAEFIQRAYPYTAGLINDRGIFEDEPDTRVAIVAYRTYDAIDEILEAVASCKGESFGSALYQCLTVDEPALFTAASATVLEQAQPEDIDGTVPNRQTHLTGISSVPSTAIHNGGQTYVHYTGVTWRPRNTRHDTQTSKYHFTGLSFIPGDSAHNAYHTYVHYGAVTFRPRGTRHVSLSTWLHDAANTFPVRGGGFLPGLPGTPGLP